MKKKNFTQNDRIAAAWIYFEIKITSNDHSSMMIDVKECYLIILFAQNEKYCVQHVDDFEQKKEVGRLKNFCPNVCEVIPSFWYAKQLSIFLSLWKVARLNINTVEVGYRYEANFKMH